MTESDFLKGWIIRSSTSVFFFPDRSKVDIRRQESGGSDSFELEVTREDGTKLRLMDFLPDKGALKGHFRHPENPSGDQKQFQLVVTLCPATFEDRKQRLFGLLRPADGRIEPGSTGVWVAEEQSPPKRDGSEA